MSINKISKAISVLILIDFFIFLFCFLIILNISNHHFNFLNLSLIILTSFLWSYILYLKGFYQIRPYQFKYKDSLHLFEAFILGIILPTFLLLFFNKYHKLEILASSFLIYPIFLMWRILFNQYVKHLKKSKNVLIFGAGTLGNIIASEIIEKPKLKYNIVGFIDDNQTKINTEIQGIKVLGTSNNLNTFIKDYNIDVIIIALNKISNDSMFNLSECANKNIVYFKMSELFELINLKIPIESITPDWFIYEMTRLNQPIYSICKRIFDVVGSLIISFVTFPIMIILVISIKMADGGKIFYTQERVGKNGVIFKMLKFRTMIEKAEENGAVWAVNNNEDPRVTRIGRIARKLRFDELPQMFNILKGEMSLVGPRPERPEFTQMLEKVIPFYQRRHWVTPGWTGWAQIMYRYGASIEDAMEKLRYDLYYIKHCSLFWDFSILIKAVAMALGGRHG